MSGSWPVSEFARLLDRLNSSYRYLNGLEFFSRALSNERARNEEAEEREENGEEDHTVENLLRGRWTYSRYDTVQIDDVEFSDLILLAEQYTGALHLWNLRYSSPGFVEVLASFNPLKLIADFIIEWRKQNIEKERVHLEHQAKIAQIRTGAAIEVIKLAESLHTGRLEGSRWPELSREVLLHLQSFVSDVAPDIRVGNVLVSTTHELPPKSAKNARRNLRR